MSAAPVVANPAASLLVSLQVHPCSKSSSGDNTNNNIPTNDSTNTNTTTSNRSNKNNTVDETANGIIIMSKDGRRRFKKLRKKASRFHPESDRSGLVSREEWEEVKQTRRLPPASTEDSSSSSAQKDPQWDDFCPWIGLRQTKKRLQEIGKVRDGFDHRVMLKSLYLQQQQQQQKQDQVEQKGDNRKRKRDDPDKRGGGLSIPPFMSVHNPVCVDHLAVLEIQVQGTELSLDDIDAVLTTTNNYQKAVPPSDDAGAGHLRRGMISEGNLIPTEWFQGPRPQSISDVLLYEKPAQPSSKKKSKQSSNTPDGTSPKLEKTLQSMILSPKQMNQEGYPTLMVAPQQDENASNDGRSIAAATTSTTFRKPSSFTLEEARAIVQQAHVSVNDEAFPFVMHPSNRVSSANAAAKNDTIRVFGLDCEMVKTGKGTELGRITLIQYTDDSKDPTNTKNPTPEKRYQVLMDELVLPYPPILDYVTQYSGITAALLKDVTIRLEQIQASLLTFVRPEDILVGHSLENDLVATRWVHPTVVDTAVLFRTNASFKHSLKHLSNVLLKKKIQDGDHHCSEEDAAAALELAIGRAEQGPAFAIHPRDRLFWIPTDKKHNENATVFIGPSQWLQNHITRHPNAMHALTCETIDSPNRKAVLSWLTGPKRRAGLVWANLVVETPEHVKLLGELLVSVTYSSFFFA